MQRLWLMSNIMPGLKKPNKSFSDTVEKVSSPINETIQFCELHDGVRPDLHYLVESLYEVLRLDVVAAGDLFITDEHGYVVHVRSNQFLSDQVLYPGANLYERNQAIQQALESGSAATIIGKEFYSPPEIPSITLAIPVINKKRIIACVGFVTATENQFSINMVRSVINTAIHASTKMVEARQTIDELYILQEFYHNLDNSVGVMVLDNHLHILQVNRETEFILGLGKDDLCGKPISDFINQSISINCSENKSLLFSTSHKQIKTKTNITPLLNSHGFRIGWRLSINSINPRVSVSKSGPAMYEFDNIIGSNPDFIRLIKLARAVSRSPSSVLITGESGTGKELFAQSIHGASTYVRGPFVALNCAAIPSELIETELFGYVEGAFTGAKKQGYQGKILQANHGTLFLDEIGDMPLDLQTKLLRFLQERVIVPVGGSKTIPVDIRVISATNQDLEKMIKENRFRADLYYRLNVINLNIPPLKRRRDDIPILIKHFLSIYTNRLCKEKCIFSDTALEKLIEYDWPGNVRELQNVVERAMNLTDGEVGVEHLPDRIASFRPELSIEDAEELLTLDEMEKRQIIKALQFYEGNISQAAEALNIGRTTLYRKIRKYKLVRLVNVREGEQD